MPRYRFSPLDYVAAGWRILRAEGLEYIFPDESSAWVFEPDGTFVEFRSKLRSDLPQPISQAYIIQTKIIRDEELNEYGFFPLDLDALHRLLAEERSGIKFYRTGHFIGFYRNWRIELLRYA